MQGSGADEKRVNVRYVSDIYILFVAYFRICVYI